jgi:hypothetical protein
MTSRTRMSGVTVIGSRTTPDSKRLTFRPRRLLGRRAFLVDDADAALLRDRDRESGSVTVSIAAETSGMFSAMLRVRRVARARSRGSTVEWAGTSRTSSKVSAFWILRQPPAAASAAPSTTPSPTSGADDAAKSDTKPADAPKTLAEREMEFRKRQQERAATERKAQEEQQKSVAKAADCERSRGYLRALEEGQRITRTDASGNREFLDDAQRAQEVERTRKLVQSLCN